MRNATSRILLARDAQTGEVLTADDALHLPPEGTYQCLDPHCEGDLNVCRWPKRPGHFYFRHRAETASETCGFHAGNAGTPRRHEAAKHLLAIVLREAIHHRMPMPLLEFPGSGTPRHVLPLLCAAEVVCEWTCQRTGRRSDIAVLDSHCDAVLLVEVFHTHAVDRDKKRDYLNYWWVEIDANAIIANHERLPVRHSGNLPYGLAPGTHQRTLPGMRQCAW